MTKPKKKLHEDLDRVLDFYERQVDFIGGKRTVPVLFSPKELDRFARRADPKGSVWMYRGFNLVRTQGAKP